MTSMCYDLDAGQLVSPEDFLRYLTRKIYTAGEEFSLTVSKTSPYTLK